MEKFLTETKKIEAVREVFMGIYGLEFDEHGDRAVQMALEKPEKYVCLVVEALKQKSSECDFFPIPDGF